MPARLREEGFSKRLIDILVEVSESILSVYDNEKAWHTRSKSDNSPVTYADILSNCFLKEALTNLLPGVPFLSEEDEPVAYQDRRAWSCCWLVDPLDGTQEFLQRSGEFSVNVALIVEGEPILGALAVPVSGAVYVGVVEQGALLWRNGELTELKPLHSHQRQPVLAVSRRPEQCDMSLFAQAIGANPAYWRQGGALKFCAMAEGAVDVYPRFSPVSEWDVAAGHALLRSLGAQVFADVGQPLRYNVRREFGDVYFCACLATEESERTVALWAQSLRDQGVQLTAC